MRLIYNRSKCKDRANIFSQELKVIIERKKLFAGKEKIHTPQILTHH